MLTCINPSVNFKVKTGTYKGVAVALKWLLPLVKQFGRTHPREEAIRRDIVTLGIGDGKGITQYFNKYPDGTCISRRAGGVEVIGRKCVIIKHSSFGDESWKTFSEGTLKSTVILRKSQKHVLTFCAAIILVPNFLVTDTEIQKLKQAVKYKN